MDWSGAPRTNALQVQGSRSGVNVRKATARAGEPMTAAKAAGPRVAAFVAGGPMALAALEALADAYPLVAIVKAEPNRSVLRRVAAKLTRTEDPVSAWAERSSVPVIRASAAEERRAAGALSALRPDLGCIATFPRRIGPQLLAAAGATCVNVHPSLLPRHRGADPLFWTYHAGDPEGGVTVHVATDELDGGAILRQVVTPIDRGEPVGEVHERCTRLAAAELVRAISELSRGVATPREQDAAAATGAPRVKLGTRYSRLDHWSAEQGWHFLAGLLERYRDPLEDALAHPVQYGRVPGFEVRDPAHAPGTIVPVGAGWEAWTVDGMIALAPELPDRGS